MDQKRCSQCGEIKATSEFYKERRVKDGLQGHCKACQATRMKEYRLAYPEKETARRKRAVTRAHSEERAAQQKEYRDTNPEKCCSKCGLAKPLSEFHKNRTRNDGLRAQCKLCCAAADKQHHAAHREQILAQQREYRQEHRSEIAARDNQYRDTHREEIAARKKRWYEANSDRLKRHRDARKAQRAAYNQRWRAANPDYRKHYNDTHKEERAASNNRRRALKAAATIEDFDIMEVWEREGYTCAYCGSTENLTIDHIVALADGGSHSLDNLTVACQSCNSSKGAKPLIEWLLWKTRLQMQLGQC